MEKKKGKNIRDEQKKDSSKKEALGKVAERRIISKNIKDLSEGLFSSLVDFVLYWLLLLPAASFGKSNTSSGIYRMFADAELLQHDVNYQSFRNAYRKLKEKGLIKSIRDWQNKKVATNEGIKRLKALLPFYDEKRPWDGNLYLIQYDVPIGQNRIRDLLRDWFLKKLGAIQLQKSLYLIFNNPQDLIKKFLKDKPDFEGNILISKLTKDGILGEENIEEFIWYKSGLAELNIEYRDFIQKYMKAERVPPAEIFKDYFSILNKDPQIPFALLPDDYLGDEAYLLFLKFFKKTLFYKYMR